MFWKWNRRKKLVAAVAAGVLVIGGGVCTYQFKTSDAEGDTKVVTKETTAQKGNLTTGIKESGNVSINALTQSFSLDWSGSSTASDDASSSQSSSAEESSKKDMAATGESTDNSTDKGQSTQNGTAANQSSFDTALVVKKVYASAGQKVEKGQKLLQLKTDSVKEVRAVYQSNYETARDAYEEAKLTQSAEKVSTEYTYRQAVSKGESAALTYQATLASLAAQVTSTKTAYQEAQNGIKTLPAQIQKLKKKIAAKKGSVSVSSQSSNSVSTAERTDMAKESNVTATTDSSTSTLTSLQQELTQKQEKLAQYRQNLTSLKSAYHAAVKAQTTGKIEAEATYQESKTAAKTAKLTYQATLSSQKADVKEAQTAYQEAKEAKKEFEAFVKGDIVRAEYSGILSEIGYAAGDSLNTATAIATYLDQDGVTVTVSVSQEDISEIQVGNPVVVSLSAYEGEEFSGEVTSISTSSDSDSIASYPVVVTLQTNSSKIYSGMSSEVIFISKEVKDVLYVSNKAITTSGTKSYVLLKQEDGSVKKTNVTTGFSDGHNVEIQSGLKEGDVVLIESQVSQ